MACLISKRGKLYRKIRLDIWGLYATYNNELSKRKKLDKTVLYWCGFKALTQEYKSFKKRRYVYRLWNRRRFKFPKKLKASYMKPRHLRNFYMVLKERNYIKFINLSFKGKLSRSFISTYLGYLEGRLMIIIYRLNIINNIFMVKHMINKGMFFINFKKKTHINTRMQLGDFLHIDLSWKSVIVDEMEYRAEQGIITRNIKNFYVNYIKLFFIFYKPYDYKDIQYPINIDLYRALDFIGPLR